MQGTHEAPETSWRLRLALFLWLANFALGWPVVAASASMAPWIGAENAAMLGAGSYGLSWLVLGLAMVLGGAEVSERGRAWLTERRSGRKAALPPDGNTSTL